MKKTLAIVTLMFCLMSASQALQPAVIGGIRDGLALGIMADEGVGRNVGIRFGLEANTGKKPLILFFGGKFYLVTLERKVPLSLGLGLVGYFGDKSEAGISLSFIFDRIFAINPLFFEVGVDVAGSGRLQAQLGYKIY